MKCISFWYFIHVCTCNAHGHWGPWDGHREYSDIFRSIFQDLNFKYIRTLRSFSPRENLLKDTLDLLLFCMNLYDAFGKISSLFCLIRCLGSWPCSRALEWYELQVVQECISLPHLKPGPVFNLRKKKKERFFDNHYWQHNFRSSLELCKRNHLKILYKTAY